MRFLLTICLLLISTSSIASGQPCKRRHASSRAPVGAVAGETPPVVPALTREQTKEVERRLSEMGYWTGAIDGVFDPATRSALIAFQKWEGRPITGRLIVAELEAIRTSVSPKAKESGYGHVEVDLDRQLLLLVNDDGDVRVLPVSTGSGEPFMHEGQTSIAYTPRGRFLVYGKEVGWKGGPLGSTYYANFISGGVAIHGSRSVPAQPASHGCIRIPLFAAREVSKLLKLGTIVLVYDKISFVSAKPWVEDPKLKQAALLNSAATAYDFDYTETTKVTSRSVGIRKARSE